MNDSWQNTLVQASKPVRYAATAALIVLALFLAAKAIDAFGNLGRTTNPYMTTITVEGTGDATAVPDVARLSFTVTESATAVAAAQTAATTKMNDSLAKLKELGIDDKDVKTTSYSISPKYEYPQPCYSGICPAVASSPRIVGYDVAQTVEVTVRDTAKAGDVLQALGTLGVQNVYGPNFTVDDDESVKAEARSKAVAQATEKAKKLAKDLGVHLGKVTSFYENSGGYPMYDSYSAKGGVAMTMAAPAPTLPTGEQKTTVSVSVTYEIR